MPTAAAPAGRRSVWPYVIGAAVLLAVLGGGAWAIFSEPDAAGMSAGNGPVAVVARGLLIVSVTESGEVKPEKRKVISNEIRYPVIIKELVEEGDRVKKGETIITFECRELLDEIEGKKLAVTNAKNTYLQADENVELDKKEQDNLVRRAEQAVVDAEADLRRYMEAGGPVKIDDANSAIHTARRDLALAEDRLNFKLKVNADEELNKPFSENDIEVEKLSVEKLKIALRKAVSEYGMLLKYDDPREKRTLQMAVEDAKLALERAKHTAKSKLLTSETDRETKKVALDLQTRQLDDLLQDANKLVIVAEEEGLVVYDTGGSRWRPTDTVVEVGAKVSPRQQLMIIPDMTTLLIKTKVYEAIIDQVKPGLKAHVRLDARPDSVLPAHVVKVGVLPDSQHDWLNPGVKVFKVDIDLDEDVPDLRPGTSAQVEIELLRLSNVLSVPVAAVFTEQERTCCYRSVNGRVDRAEVKLGHMNDTRVQILSGLTEGDEVLLNPPISAEGGAGQKKEEKQDEGDEPQPPQGPDRDRGPEGKQPDPSNGPAGGRPGPSPDGGARPGGSAGAGRARRSGGRGGPSGRGG